MATVMIQHCPTCRAEVREGMTRCRDCGTALPHEFSAVASTDTATDLPLLSKEGKVYSRCPHCGKKIKAQRELAGMLIKCPRCDGPVRIPHLADQGAAGGHSNVSGATPLPPTTTAHIGSGPASSGVHAAARSSDQHVPLNGAALPNQPPVVVPAYPYPQFAGQVMGYAVPFQPQTPLTGIPAQPNESLPAASPAAEATVSETPRQSPVNNPSRASGLLSGIEITRIHAICAECGKRVNAASTFAGHKVSCPRCGVQILLPGEPPQKLSSKSSLATTTSSTASGQGHSMVMSALLLRSVEAALEFPPSVPETPEEQVQPLQKKVLRKHLDAIAEVAANAKSPQKDAALEGLQAIAGSHDAQVVPELIEALKTASGTVKLRIIQTLGELRCPQSFETVLRRTVTASGPELTACLQSLGLLGDVRAALPILYAVQKYPDQRIRGFDAIVAMGKPVMSELSRIAAEAVENDVQFSIAEMLSRFAGACPVDTFSRLMAHPTPLIRQRAAESLSLVADGNAVGMLLRALEDHDPIVRMFAAKGLRLAPSSSAAKALLKAIDDPDRDVRLAALGALGECDQQAVKPALLQRLEDPDVEVSIIAAEALARMGDPNGVPKLVDILETQPTNSEEGYALRIVEGFRKFKDKRTTLPMLNLLLCDDATLRLRAVESLAQGSDRSCRPSIEKLLKYDKSDDVRQAAAKALGDLGDPEAREALQAALHDSTQIRLKAVISLGQLRAKDSLPALIELLSDPSPQVKYQTLRAIADIRDPSAISAIEPLVDSSDEMVKRAALKALQDLGDKRDEANLKKSVKKKTKEEQKPTVKKSGRRFSLFDLVPSPLLGLMESLRYNRKTAMGATVVALGLGAVGVWYFLGRGGGGSNEPIMRGTVVALSISPDGKYVAAGRNRGMLEIWDIESQSIAGTSGEIPTQYVAFGPGGSSLLAIQGTQVASATIDGGYPGEVTEITQLGKQVIDFSVNHDHTYAVSLCADQLMYRWDLTSPKAEAPLQSSQTLMAVAISNDGSQVAGATEQGVLVAWSFETGEIAAETQASIQGGVTAIAFQQDGELIVAATGNGELLLWDPAESRPPRVNTASMSGVSELSFPPGGEVIVCRRSGEVQRWKVADDTLATFTIPLDIVSAMSLSSDHIAVGSEEMTEILLMNRASGTVETSLDE